MPDEIYLITNYVQTLAIMSITGVGVYRALQMRKGFVYPTYRSRAAWSAFLLAVIFVSNVNNLIPYPPTALADTLGIIPFAAIILTAFAFVDTTIFVAIRSDFFHRSILRWSQVRKPYAIILLASIAFFFIVVASTPAIATSNSLVPANASIWVVIGLYQFIFLVGVILLYAAAALVISARRTPDLNLKKHLRLLGYSLGTFALSIIISGVSSSGAGIIISDIVGVLAAYLLYRSVMSLSPLGKIDEARVGASAQGP